MRRLHRQARVDARGSVDLHVGGSLEGREPGGAHLDFVVAGQEVSLAVIAVGVALGLISDTAVGVGDGDVSVRNRRAAGIGHGPKNAAEHCLAQR